MKIIGVAVVLHGRVPAVWAMHVAVIPRVSLMSVSHCFQSFRKRPPVVARTLRVSCGGPRSQGVPIPLLARRFIKSSWMAESGPSLCSSEWPTDLAGCQNHEVLERGWTLSAIILESGGNVEQLPAG
jgi:hypothetical protein